MDIDQRVRKMETDFPLLAHRLDAIDGKLVEVNEHVTRIFERLDSVTRLQEADSRHQDNIQRALAEIAELRKDSREETSVQRIRWERAAKDSDERWTRYVSERADIRARLEGDIHSIERRLSWFAGVLAVAQVVLGIVAWVYTADLSRLLAANDKQDTRMENIASHVTDNTQRLTAIEAAVRSHLQEKQP